MKTHDPIVIRLNKEIARRFSTAIILGSNFKGNYRAQENETN